MANITSPFGFRQFRRAEGGAPTAGFETLTIMSSDASVIFTGDPVADLTSPSQGFGNYVTGTTAGNSQIRGIFMGCEYYLAAVNRKVWSPYFPGSVATTSGTGDIQAWVCTDPEMLWITQVSGTAGSTGSVLTSSYVNLNFGFSSASMFTGSYLGNTTTGISNVTLNSTSFATTATLPFRLIDFYSNWGPPGSNGTDNTTNGQFVIVGSNNWDRSNTTGV